MFSINEYVDDILSSELNKDTSNKLINKIDDDINFKYNSFNICIGKQSTGKTTSVLKELIKLSLKNINTFHLVIYVSNNNSDDTFNKLYNYINIPIVKTDYEHLDNQFMKLIKLKEEYNKMVDGDIPKNKSILQCLYVHNFNLKRLHTSIIEDSNN